MAEEQRIVLASGSAARAAMLRAAGVPFEVVPADVDEQRFRQTLWQMNMKVSPGDLATALAKLKAEEVSRRFEDAIVIGSDQVLALGERTLSKPGDTPGARRQLQSLRGEVHVLHSAVAIARNGGTIATEAGIARMTMRDFSDAFLEDYLARAGEAIFSCVGSYQIEGLGVTLFERIEGDHFTILGMPLMPLLANLRDLKAIPA